VDAEFSVASVTSGVRAGDVLFGYDILTNKALTYQTDTPFDPNVVGNGQLGHGCYQVADTTGVTDHELPTANVKVLCAVQQTSPCPAAGATITPPAKPYGHADATMSVPLGHLVSKLNAQGQFSLFFHRVVPNPIAGATLQWIATQACKVDVAVEFVCTGASCVEVTTIVCASFAGIDADSKATMNIECKVPNTFPIDETCSGTASNAGIFTDVESVPGDWPSAASQSNTGGKTTYTRTGILIPQNGNKAGNIKLTACIGDADTFTPANGCTNDQNANSQDTGCNANFPLCDAGAGLAGTVCEQVLTPIEVHQADYNLTRASRAITGLVMPVQVSFFTDGSASGTWVAPSHGNVNGGGATTNLALQFTSPAGAPFLAQQKVQLGVLTRNHDAYLRIIAQIPGGTSTHWFLNPLVTESQKNGALFTTATCTNDQASPAAQDSGCTAAHPVCNGKSGVTNDGTGCSPSCVHFQTAPSLANYVLAANNGVYRTTGSNFPVTYLRCENFMGTAAGNGATHITAGDTVVFTLTWKIGKLTSTTGKAQLLQDAQEPDPAAQSVEVQLTIQLGGGETTITTGAGAGEGSADNTVTYIIIAVCVIAAALILAVVVVAFMCMKNRANEQLVAMSPQKCTVAAVYDISAPKKADAMDV
jgi:hypothetical protein